VILSRGLTRCSRFYHEVFNEPAEDQARMFQDLENWLSRMIEETHGEMHGGMRGGKRSG
jgi:hypothetical protein